MDMATLADLRKSVRNFTDTPIDEKSIQELTDYFETCKKLKDDIKTKTVIVKKDDLPDEIKDIGGYNGFLIEAPYYILIFSERKSHFIENAGYIGEDIILKMTDMGIDSCWITLKEEKVLEKPEAEMRVTGLIAAGYGGKYRNPKLINKMIWGNGYDNLKIQKLETDNEVRMDLLDMVFIGDYGNKAEIDDLINSGIAEAFYAARRAPSALNRQPWRFILDRDVVVLVIKKDEYTNIYENDRWILFLNQISR